jgi:hypothetical protein
MRRWWQGLGLVTALLLGLSGCKGPQQQIKPPKNPEEYVDPPQGDKRYEGPIEYPKGTLNQDRQIYGKEFNPIGAPGGTGTPRSAGSRMGSGY